MGLLLQRMLTAALLIYDLIAHLKQATQFEPTVSHFIAAVMGILIAAGLWTPVVGTLVAIVELSIIFSHGGGPWPGVVLATLGASLAMIGPGAWSLDARLFGRKRIRT